MAKSAQQKKEKKREKHTQAIAKMERHKKILELYEAGKTAKEIADALGYASTHSPEMIIKQYLHDAIIGSRDNIINNELARLEVMWQEANRAFLAGNQQSAQICLQIIAQKRALLGLDAPKRVETNGITPPKVIQIVVGKIGEERPGTVPVTIESVADAD